MTLKVSTSRSALLGRSGITFTCTLQWRHTHRAAKAPHHAQLAPLHHAYLKRPPPPLFTGATSGTCPLTRSNHPQPPCSSSCSPHRFRPHQAAALPGRQSPPPQALPRLPGWLVRPPWEDLGGLRLAHRVPVGLISTKPQQESAKVNGDGMLDQGTRPTSLPFAARRPHASSRGVLPSCSIEGISNEQTRPWSARRGPPGLLVPSASSSRCWHARAPFPTFWGSNDRFITLVE